LSDSIKIKSSALKIGVIYLVIGVLWILLSDSAVREISMHNKSLEETLQTYKGIFYVISTAVLLFFIIRNRERRREKLENDIIISNEKWQNVFESANDPIFVLDKKYNILETNQRAQEVYGYSADEFREMNIKDIRSESDHDVIKMHMNEALNQSGAKYEMHHLKKDSSSFPVEISTRAVTREGSLEFIHIVHDLSDRKQIENKLIDSEQKYRTLVETSHELIWILDKDFRFTFVNDASRKIYGIASADLLGRKMNDFVSDEDSMNNMDIIAEAIESGKQVFQYQNEIIGHDGKVKYLLSNCVIIKNKKGVFAGLCGTSLDITERVEAENRVKYLNRIYALLSNTNKLIVRASDKEHILNEACRLAVEYGKFKMAWIGIPNEKTRNLDKKYKYGDEGDYLDSLKISIDEPENLRGPIVTAIKENTYYVSNDIEHDGTLMKWRKGSLAKGFRSFATFPIEVKNKVVAVYNIYSDKKDFFGEQETQLLLELVEDISFALEYIELNSEREVIEKRYENIVERTPVAILVQLEGSIVYANPSAVKILKAKSYKELLNKTIHDIIHKDYHAVVNENLKELYLGREVNEIEEKMIRMDGSYADVMVSAIPYSQNGQKGSLIFFRDLTEQKKARQDMLELNERLNLVTKATNDAIWDWNLITDDMWWSDGFNELFGYSADEIEKGSDSWVNRIHPQDLEFVMRGINSVIDGGKEFWFDEYRFRKKDNSYAYVFDRGYVVRDEEGKPYRMIGSMIDITYRKKIEEDLKASEEKYRSIYENSPSRIIVIDRSYKIISINRVSPHIIAEKIIGKSVFEFITSEDIQRIKEAYEYTFNTSKSTEYTSRMFDYNNNSAFYHVLVAPQIKNGKVEFLTLIATDITEKVKSEEALIESRARLKALVDSAMDAILSLNSKKEIVLFNEAAEKMFKYSFDEVKLKGLNILFPEKSNEKQYRILDRNTSLNVAGNYMGNVGILTGLRSDGVEFPIEASISHIKVNGETYYTAIFRDVTERMEYENAINASNDKLHALAAHLQIIREEERTLIAREIHDQLGQELTALKMDISFLSKKIEKSKVTPDWDGIRDGLKSMSEITDHTINSVRRIATELRPDILDKLGLKEAIEWHAEEFEKRSGIKCVVKVNTPELNLSPQLNTTVYRIVQESLTNVARHSKANRADVDIKVNGEKVYLSIKDNGRGIMESEIENSKSLGLVGIKERAYTVNGEFEIKGEKGKGTEIKIAIPIE
jgi:PAS domain S-box-containing protein